MRWGAFKKKWPYLVLFVAGALLILLGFASRSSFPVEQFGARDLTEEFIREAFLRLQTAAIGFGILIMVATPLLYLFRDQLSRASHLLFRTGDDFYADKGTKRKAIDLFLISFLGLFLEMLVIRWLSAEFRLFAYFKNLPLLAAFMGLGIGFALVRRRDNLFPLAIPLITLLCGLILFGTRTAIFDLIRYPAQEEFIWALSIRSSLVTVVVFCGAIVFFFFLTMIMFLPFGQLTGRLMNKFSPLTGYTINILGSLFGIWAFSAISFLSLPPFYWFLMGLLLCLWFLQEQRYLLLGNAAVAVVCLVLLFLYRGESLWSPYYRVDLDPVFLWDASAGEEVVLWGYRLIVNQDYHQKALDLSPEFASRHSHLSSEVKMAQRAYDLPYDFVRPRDVLVVGAGAGNDVASALRHGATRVDAVEIDPLIADLGEKLHPEMPYQAPQVHVIVDDARSFFEKSDEKYDLIVFGFLDSHTLFSSMSSVRLDNFVYTIECFEEAKDHLKDDGMVALTFSVAKKWIGTRLRDMLANVFEMDPLAFEVGYDGGLTFIVGPGAENLELSQEHRLQQLAADRRLDYKGVAPAATDDWPYLYLKEHQVPDVYWQVLLLLLVLSVIVILTIFPESTRVNFHFFFLGCAFFLIETKSITETALLFGSTWIVNSVVISAILAMILAANLFVRKRKPTDVRPYYTLLLGSLLLNYMVPVSSMLGQNFLLRGLISGFAISLPVFFAGIIFAISLSKMKTVELAFGSNLLGSVVGGMLEYSSLIYGIRSLYILAAFMYILSLIAVRRRTS
jgi:spermidine synthase